MIGRRRPLLAVSAVALVLPLAAPTGQAAAPTKVKVGVDSRRDVSFQISGRNIEVTLRPKGDVPNPLAAQLAGTTIVLACKGSAPKRKKAAVGVMETNWPNSQSFMRGWLDRDVSVSTQWCVLEYPDGTDIAVARKLRAPKPVSQQAPDGAAATTPVATTPPAG